MKLRIRIKSCGRDERGRREISVCTFGFQVVALRNGSESWDLWENLPIPIRFHVYVFHVNNPKEILEGKMPNVTERGPYVYRETRQKKISSLDEGKSSVTYQQTFLFEFDEKESGHLKEDDEVTVVNLPATVGTSYLYVPNFCSFFVFAPSVYCLYSAVPSLFFDYLQYYS